MRLGVVGMVPSDPREITPAHLESVRAINLSSANFHVPAELQDELGEEDCRRVRRLYESEGMALVQMGLGFSECLFHPDAEERRRCVETIGRGIELARQMEADICLFRTGSLNPAGPYSPSPENRRPECYQRLVESLAVIARKAESVGQRAVLETHQLTILDSPETNRRVLEEVGSDQLGVVMDAVNHFQSLFHVYDSTARLHEIFDVMGQLCPVGHCKDLSVDSGLVLHIREEVPGEGELDVSTLLRRWQDLDPEASMLLEHLAVEKYPLASDNVHRIAAEAGVEIH